MEELAEKDRILRNVLLANLKNPNIVTNKTLIEIGTTYFLQDTMEGLNDQTDLVAEHRPKDLENYLQGLLDAGVPADIVETQRSRAASFTHPVQDSTLPTDSPAKRKPTPEHPQSNPRPEPSYKGEIQ